MSDEIRKFHRTLTEPRLADWPPSEPAFRRSEVTALIGSGPEVWERASTDVLQWVVKTRSGFRVADSSPVSPGQLADITIGALGINVVEPVEPVEVLDVVTEPGRVGFSYRTRPGHPVDGEEAFVVHRDGDDVFLTIRSLTRASRTQPWRLLFPLLLVAQRVVRRRYLRALS